MKRKLILGLCALMLIASGSALAADNRGQSGGGHMGAHAAGQPGPANQAYMKAMDGMHEEMMIGVMDVDPDTAFVRGMIPHHEGAVEMARIELQYGQDPQLRKLAQEIISAQEKEIQFMEKWLEQQAKGR